MWTVFPVYLKIHCMSLMSFLISVLQFLEELGPYSRKARKKFALRGLCEPANLALRGIHEGLASFPQTIRKVAGTLICVCPAKFEGRHHSL